jgi:hypothetical protein
MSEGGSPAIVEKSATRIGDAELERSAWGIPAHFFFLNISNHIPKTACDCAAP